jgi:hypothetical protein
MCVWSIFDLHLFLDDCYYRETFFPPPYFKISHDDLVICILAQHLMGHRSISTITSNCKMKEEQTIYEYNDEQ